MTEPNLKISIVTPTLNSAGYLGDLLAAVDAQTYSNIEHVIVDGESTDGTVDMIRQYAADHDVNWVSEPDSGNIDATTKGLKMATGDVVVIVPSDDLIFPWSVATAAKYLHAHPEVEVVHGDSISCDIVTDVWSLRLYKRFTYGYLARTQILTPQATFFRRHVLAGQEELDHTLPHACDYDQIMRVTRGRKVVNIPEILAIFRKRPGAINLQEGVTEAISKEVAIARARYIRTTGPVHAAMVKWDRVYGALHRRMQIFRMVKRSRKVTRSGDGIRKDGPWHNFLDSYSVTGGSTRGMISTMMPGRRQYDLDIRSRTGAKDLGAAERPESSIPTT